MARCACARLANGWAKLPSLASLPVVDTKNPDADGLPAPPPVAPPVLGGVPVPTPADALPPELPDAAGLPNPAPSRGAGPRGGPCSNSARGPVLVRFEVRRKRPFV